MLKNYMKVALRNILRYKGYAFVNVAGLAIGMACCLLFSLYYLEETSYDRYHIDNDRVFRIAQVSQPRVDQTSSAITTAPLAPLLKERLPQVELAARAMPMGDVVVKREQTLFYEQRAFWSESDLFGILTIPFLEGNPQTALDRPLTAVLTEGLALKYFGATNVLGQTLRVGSRDYEITGVVANAPFKTHFKYDLFVSLKTLEGRYPFDEWRLASFYTYAKLSPEADVTALTAAMNKETLPFTAAAEDQDNTAFVLQPVASIHLHSHLREELDRPGSPFMLAIVLLVGILVLAIACLNFANLTTARSSLRAKEVALRYSVGAVRCQLVRQLLGESVILATVAFIAAVVIVELLLPSARLITGASLETRQLLQPFTVLLFLAIMFGSGLLAGIYPAFVLTTLQPAAVLKGASAVDLRKPRARRLLVTAQLAIAVIFVAFAVTVFSQVRHMQEIPLGFSSGERMVARNTMRRGQDYRTFKQELQRLPEIAGVTASSAVPGVECKAYWATWLINADDKTSQPMNYLYCDEDFVGEYGIRMVAGRSFSRAITADSAASCIINLAAMRLLGFDTPEQALGVNVYCGTSDFERTVIGVTDDFHYEGLQKVVEPLVMDLNPRAFEYLSIRLQPGDTRASIASISSAWRKAFPDNPLDWFLLDNQFNRQYQSEERFGRLLLGATAFGLLIACMGLMGLTALAAARRSKEIGIRKVLGASTSNVVLLLAEDLGRAMVLAFVIAWPVGYWVMHRWLQNFAYRTNLGIGIFLFSSLTVLIIAALTVSYQAVKAATANPAESLKHE